MHDVASKYFSILITSWNAAFLILVLRGVSTHDVEVLDMSACSQDQYGHPEYGLSVPSYSPQTQENPGIYELHTPSLRKD